MDNEILVQALLDSFDVIKDDWKTKSDAIVNAIVAMTRYHFRRDAYEMWLYITENQKNNLDELNSQKLITDIFGKIGIRDEYYDGNSDKRFSVFSRHLHWVYELYGDGKLYELFFRYSYNYCIKDLDFGLDNMRTNPLGWIYANLITENDLENLKIITKAIVENSNYDKVSPAFFFRTAASVFNENYYGENGFHVSISDRARMLLLEIIDTIKDDVMRSESIIAVLSIR